MILVAKENCSGSSRSRVLWPSFVAKLWQNYRVSSG